MLAGCGVLRQAQDDAQLPLSSSPAGPSTALRVTTAERSPERHTYRVLHSFGGSGDGKTPFAGLLDVKGMLYGTTAKGGANNDGAVPPQVPWPSTNRRPLALPG
jgi:hypothetical protein